MTSGWPVWTTCPARLSDTGSRNETSICLIAPVAAYEYSPPVISSTSSSVPSSAWASSTAASTTRVNTVGRSRPLVIRLPIWTSVFNSCSRCSSWRLACKSWADAFARMRPIQ